MALGDLKDEKELAMQREEVGLAESIPGRNDSISKGPGTGKASCSSVLSWEGCETSGKG